MIEGCFTVTFENPYWVGIFERYDERGYSAAKIIFGSEPNAEMIRLVVLGQYRGLVFSEPIPERPPAAHEGNYKRRQRELKRLLEQADGVTEEAAKRLAAETLAAERERRAQERKQREKAEREAEEAHKFQLRQEHKKEKKKGH